MTGAGGKMQSTVGSVNSLGVAGTKLTNLPVLAAYFLNMLGNVVGTGLDGVIGYNYLQAFRVSIDYPNETLYLD